MIQIEGCSELHEGIFFADIKYQGSDKTVNKHS